MMTIYYLAEVFTTFVEIYVLLYVFAFFFDKRFLRITDSLAKVIGSIFLTWLTMFLNSIQLFSVFTGTLWIVLVSLAGWMLYKDNLLKILAVSTMYILLIAAFDFFCFSVMEFLMGFEGISFTLNSKIGWFRTTYILSVKFILILAYFIFRAIVKDKKYTFSNASGLTMIAYGAFCISCMQNLFGAVATDDIIKMRKSVLLAWLFIMICAISIIIMLRNRSRYISEKQERFVVTKQIEILEKNNTQLNSAYKEMAKMSHDFNNQIRTICTMAADTDNKELQEYTRDLVKDLEDIKIITYTGIDSIDAVINRKQKQAQENDITMNISVTPFETVGIRNIDLCVILANLFDNAIEACERIRIKEDRYINFKFSKVGDMIVIKIDNSFDYNLSIKAPNGKLLTTKTEAHFHGYGLKIIDSIVEKYSGIIETKHNEDVFTVNVMLDD